MDLLAILSPVAAEKGPGFIKYDESEKQKDASVQPEKILMQADIMRQLAEGKSITKSKITEVLKQLLEDNKDNWKMKTDEIPDWLTTMCKRIANSQHVLHAARSKSSVPKWYKTLMAKGEDEDKKKQQEVIFEYHFDKTELGLPYRIKAGSKNKEIAKDVKLQEPHQPILGTFEDGEHEIVCITGQEYQATKNTAKRVAEEILWSGQHSESQNKLRVKERPDRGLLISLFEQANQACQVHVDLFESDTWRKENRPGTQQNPDHFKVPNSEAAKLKAVDFMIELANSYANAEVEKAKLYDHRDERLTALGLKKASRGKAPEAKMKAVAKAKTSSSKAEGKNESAAKRRKVIQRKPAADPAFVEVEPDAEQEEIEEEDDDGEQEDEESSVSVEVPKKPAAAAVEYLKAPDWRSLEDVVDDL